MLDDIKYLLDRKVRQFNTPAFIDGDPVSIPHLFSSREDIEISGFLTSVISWGNRKSILTDSRKLMHMMQDDPYRFVLNATPKELMPLRSFVHRTFNGDDCFLFIMSLKNLYRQYGTLEDAFMAYPAVTMAEKISAFRSLFFIHTGDPGHSGKHLPDPLKGSAAKRINMFLRWMVRKDNAGVDFGIWNKILPSELICPLDVHSSNTARSLGILHRKVNDWKGAEELTSILREFDPEDPVKYDFALFGLGAYGEIF